MIDLEQIFERPAAWIAVSLFIPILFTALSWALSELALQLRRTVPRSRENSRRRWWCTLLSESLSSERIGSRLLKQWKDRVKTSERIAWAKISSLHTGLYPCCFWGRPSRETFASKEDKETTVDCCMKNTDELEIFNMAHNINILNTIPWILNEYLEWLISTMSSTHFQFMTVVEIKIRVSLSCKKCHHSALPRSIVGSTDSTFRSHDTSFC